MVSPMVSDRYKWGISMLKKAKQFIRICSEQGIRSAFLEFASYMRGCIFKLYSLSLSQQRLFDEDWEIAIILDACRADTLREVSSEYPWLSSIETKYSVGPDSPTWMDRTFSGIAETDLSDTAYVTANPFSRTHAPRNIGKIEEVWKYAWDDELGTVPPRPVTDIAIQTIQEDHSRIIIHYMQPHFPSIPSNLGYKIEKDDAENSDWVWESSSTSEFSKETLYNAYKDNLRFVLREVGVLLNSVDSDNVVITADHANAFGEYGVWGHPRNQPAPAVLEVPWARVVASDTGSHEPEDHKTHEGSVDPSEQLEALGYK